MPVVISGNERAAIIGRREQDQAEQPFAVDQGNADPGTTFVEHPLRRWRPIVLG